MEPFSPLALARRPGVEVRVMRARARAYQGVGVVVVVEGAWDVECRRGRQKGMEE